ncbi:MAG: hypothetical protein KC416_01210 [Myxococcales bacterium]|nr:hypothetical protein [Myxococcales bacterium]
MEQKGLWRSRAGSATAPYLFAVMLVAVPGLWGWSAFGASLQSALVGGVAASLDRADLSSTVASGAQAAATGEELTEALRKFILSNGEDPTLATLVDDPSLLALLPELTRILKENPGIGDVVLEFLEAGEIDLSDPRVADILPDLIDLIGNDPNLLSSLETLTDKLKADPTLAEDLREVIEGEASTSEALDLLVDDEVAEIVEAIAQDSDLAEEIFGDEVANVITKPGGTDAAVAVARAKNGDILGAIGSFFQGVAANVDRFLTPPGGSCSGVFSTCRLGGFLQNLGGFVSNVAWPGVRGAFRFLTSWFPTGGDASPSEGRFLGPAGELSDPLDPQAGRGPGLVSPSVPADRSPPEIDFCSLGAPTRVEYWLEHSRLADAPAATVPGSAP